MKKLLIPLVLLTLFGFTVSDTTLTKADRKMAADEMMASKDRLFKAVKGLSEAQLNLKSSPESWSIAECVEHITLSEGLIFGMLEKALETPANAARRSEVKIPDNNLLSMIKDRSNKVQTREPFEPSGKYGSYKATLKAFKTKRTANIKYVKKTKDDLRNHYRQLPFGTIDGLQVLLFMSGHTDRHIAQIEEIKSHGNFPSR